MSRCYGFWKDSLAFGKRHCRKGLRLKEKAEVTLDDSERGTPCAKQRRRQAARPGRLGTPVNTLWFLRPFCGSIEDGTPRKINASPTIVVPELCKWTITVVSS